MNVRIISHLVFSGGRYSPVLSLSQSQSNSNPEVFSKG